MAFAIMRVAMLTNKSRGKNSIGGSIRHLENHSKAAEISRPELSHLNLNLIETFSYKEAQGVALNLREKHNKSVDEWNSCHEQQKRHLKKDASQFFEAVFTYSPEAEQTMNIDKWSKETYHFIKEEFLLRGCIPIRFDIHRDEQTTHIHLICAAFDEQTQNCTTRNILGNKADLCALQDRYAEAMKPLELERGHSRYREYQSIKSRAEAEGLSVPEYAQKYKIDIPKRRHHKSIGEWKAEQQATGKALEMKVDNIKEELESLRRLRQDALENCIDPEEFRRLTRDKLHYKAMVDSSKDVNLTRADGTECSAYDLIVEATKERVELIKEIEKPEEEISVSDNPVGDDDNR